MTTCNVVTVGGDIAFTGPAEDACEYMRTHIHADRVVRANDGVTLAVCQPFDLTSVWRWGFNAPGAPEHSL